MTDFPATAPPPPGVPLDFGTAARPPSAPAETPGAAVGPTATARPGADGFHRPLSHIVAALALPIPARLVASKKVPTKGGSSYSASYVHHATVRDLLDHHAPGWLWSVRLYDTAGTLYVVGTLTLVGSDGTQARDGIGNEADDLDGYGDPSSNAEAQALRRAAMAHGLCRDLWRK